jgi:hypothetical protein
MPPSASDIDSVLDVATGDVDELRDAATTLDANDTTPDVSSGGSVFKTNNDTSTRTITGFDGPPGSGKLFLLVIGDAFTAFDFTSSNLVGHDQDFNPTENDVYIFWYNASNSKTHLVATFPKTFTATISGIEFTECIYIEDPTDADDLTSIFANKTSGDFTITEIWCESDQTIDFDLQIDDGTPADVNGTDIQCAAGEAEDTSLGGDTTLAAGEELDLVVTSTANTPTWVTICWTFTN